jgi:protein SCO1
MSFSKKTWLYIGVFSILVIGFYTFLLSSTDLMGSRLPVLSIVKPYSLTRQDGKVVSETNALGKVVVVEYFFTTCKGICPKMNTNMKKIHEEFRNESNFLILSHTVDPETDNVERLKFYSDSLGADIKGWWFLTGTKADLYKGARESYILDDVSNNQGNIEEQFIHTQFFALVDKEGRVRGIYDGLKKDEIEKIRKDIRDLLKH